MFTSVYLTEVIKCICWCMNKHWKKSCYSKVVFKNSLLFHSVRRKTTLSSVIKWTLLINRLVLCYASVEDPTHVNQWHRLSLGYWLRNRINHINQSGLLFVSLRPHFKFHSLSNIIGEGSVDFCFLNVE